MGSVNAELLTPSAGNMGASVNGVPFRIDESDVFAIQAVVSGSASLDGTLRLQASCDVGPEATAVVNWTDVPDTDEAVVSDGTFLWNIVGAGWRWVRLAWVWTSGTGTLAARVQAKLSKD